MRIRFGPSALVYAWGKVTLTFSTFMSINYAYSSTSHSSRTAEAYLENVLNNTLQLLVSPELSRQLNWLMVGTFQ